ncbi:MAG: cation diffusion facilitator family transporter [Gammaproteobacteria bacterium]|nr:MAG: cation diffusion facilitator family transporter [Gammaproteobacteria bacterium]
MAGSSKKVIFAALIGNAIISIMKFAAAVFTGSSAMFSEGIHSLVDTGNQVLLLFGLRQAKKPADKRYPFGHGKEVYFWSFVVAILIFAVGSGLSIVKGLEHIKHPQVITDPIVNYAVLTFALIVEGWVFYIAIKEFNKVKGSKDYLQAIQQGKDPGLFVVLLEDAAATLGLIVAMIGIAISQLTGNYIYDGVASVGIGIILAFVAALLAYETKGLLIGESADDEVVDGIREMVDGFTGVERVNEVLTMHMGPEYILVNLSVEFNDDIHTEQMESVIAHIDKNIKQSFVNVKRVFIEAESWKFTH